MLTTDAVALVVVMYLAFALRLGTPEPAAPLWFLLLVPVIVMPLLYLCSFYRTVVRFIGTEISWCILGCTTLTVLILSSILFLGHVDGVPRSVMPIFWTLALLYLGGSRFLVRGYFLWTEGEFDERQPIAIYGAGDTGMQLVSALARGSVYKPSIFVDESADLRGSRVHGVRVIGRDALAAALKRHGIETIVLAIPSLSRPDRLEVLRFLEQFNVRVMSVPSLSDVVAGQARVEDVRDVNLEDLLGREPVAAHVELISKPIRGRTVMVTGAGGSIGSELCRQIMLQSPTCLVLFERNEYALYTIEGELRKQLANEKNGVRDMLVVPVLGSVVDKAHVLQVCREYAVQTVYHAAAYKHVPMVEHNPIAGVQNNILGTLNTALAAEEAGVERFVLVSTDKAVRPTNVMGATKRFAELILQALAARNSATVFTMVRFGNVLGSSGSVVPLFRKQVLAGGPVTVTHRDITRYFMTVPEASQLVIQAGGMAEGGEVFVLDMGKPVRIYDLARSLIRLMGFSVRDDENPAGDIEIHVTGLRPGEKLYEELLIGLDSIRTRHPMVMQAREIQLPWQEVQSILQELRDAVREMQTSTVRGLLREHVAGYHSAESVSNVVKLEPVPRSATSAQ